jgi:hypothetical protein
VNEGRKEKPAVVDPGGYKVEVQSEKKENYFRDLHSYGEKFCKLKNNNYIQETKVPSRREKNKYEKEELEVDKSGDIKLENVCNADQKPEGNESWDENKS